MSFVGERPARFVHIILRNDGVLDIPGLSAVSGKAGRVPGLPNCVPSGYQDRFRPWQHSEVALWTITSVQNKASYNRYVFFSTLSDP
jgi:hypothetical protein